VFRIRLSLTLLEARILFVDHQQFPLSTHYLAICTSLLYGSSYLHKLKVISLVIDILSENDPAVSFALLPYSLFVPEDDPSS